MGKIPDFSNLKSLGIDNSKSKEFKFYSIEGEPTLYVKSTTDANKLYLNALLKGRKTLRLMRGRKINASVLDANREQDRELYPQFVVTGWDEKTIADSEGNDVPFSRENCELFLQALPNDIFDELRNFCGDPDEHRDGEDLDSEDVEELSGNSEPGSSGN